MEVTCIAKENAQFFEPYMIAPLSPGKSALGLMEENAAIGALVVSQEEMTCRIESVAVDPGYRRKGGGTLLIRALKETASALGVRDFLIFFEEDETAHAFLTKQSFTCMPADEVMSIPVNTILSSENFKKIKGKPVEEGIRTLGELNREELLGVEEMMKNSDFPKDIPYAMWHDSGRGKN